MLDVNRSVKTQINAIYDVKKDKRFSKQVIERERTYGIKKPGIEKNRTGIRPSASGNRLKVEDLSKPQIMIESTFGDSHPGSGHLLELVEEARNGIAEAGGHGARYFTTDICDGEAQGTMATSIILWLPEI